MPWKEETIMSQREAFIKRLQGEEVNLSALCREFGISRPTGYKWKKRYAVDSCCNLKDQSKTPHSQPTKTPESIEHLVLSIRAQHTRWGGKKILRHLVNQGFTQMPSSKTINRILKRYGCITEEESAKHKPWKRFEHEHPNDLWQMDFKGEFKLEDEQWCYPLTVLDDHSRFLLLLEACPNQRGETVKSALIGLFKKYGLPKRMTMDNGPPWGYSRAQQHTQLCAWLMRLGIQVSHSRPGHPQTQGKLERLHRTLKAELLSRYSFDDMKEAQAGFDYWKGIYNEVRPHDALNLDVPLDHYRSSTKLYPDKLSDITYEENSLIRKVQKDGMISYQGKQFLIGTPFYSYPVKLVANDENSNFIDIYFCHQKILILDLNNYSRIRSRV